MKRRVIPRLRGDRARRRLLGALLVLVGATILLGNVPTWIWPAAAGVGLAWLGALMYSRP